MNDRVRDELSRARERLLDLTLRNRLLNFRPTKRTTIEIVDERPGQLWKLLVTDRRDLTFLAQEEHEFHESRANSAEDAAAPEAGAGAESVSSADAESAAGAEAPGEAATATPPAAKPYHNPSAHSHREPVPDEPAAAASDDAVLDHDGAVDSAAADSGAETPNAHTAFAEEFSLPALKVPRSTASAGETAAARYTDLFLQTALPGEALQTSLLQIDQQARAAIEERGVNLLFLAIGFLEWRPEEDHDRICRAPLILLPIELERTSARRRFKVRALEDDPLLNPCLARKLADSRIKLPPTPESGDDEGGWDEFNVEAYLTKVAEAVRERPEWQVRPEMFLGFFSFTKYLMYVDLDEAKWPPDRELMANALLRAVCGDPSKLPAGPELTPVAELDERQDPEEVFQILDADSSQQETINAAKSGRSLVIEGPPGTGKSQTIANIIAESLAAERSVLFVSEKMAALEVVKRRLDAVGLGDFCLELHSTKANRQSVTLELGRVLEKGRYQARSMEDGARKLQRYKAGLNAYVAALHEPAGPARLTPYYAMGRVALLRDVPDIFCRMTSYETWDRERLEALKESLERLSRLRHNVGSPRQNPWRGARLTAINSESARTVGELAGKLAALVADLRRTGAEAARLIGVAAPESLAAGRQVQAAARLVAEAPQSPAPAGRLLRGPFWDELTPELGGLLNNIRLFAEDRAWLPGRYAEAGLDAVDWAGMHGRCLRCWSSPWRWLRPGYWSDRGVLKKFRDTGYDPALAEQAADLKRLARMQGLKAALESAAPVAMNYFGDSWRSLASDFSALTRLADWLLAFRKLARAGQVGEAGLALAEAGVDRAAIIAAHQAMTDLGRAWDEQWKTFRELLALQDPGTFTKKSADAPLDELAARLAEMAGGTEKLPDWAQFQELLQQCERGPLAEFLAQAIAADLPPELLPLAMEKRFLRLWMEEVITRREELRRFSGPNHEADMLSFARLDREWVARSGYRLHGRLASRKPEGLLDAARTSQLGILQGEIRRKRGGRPIRRLLRDAAEVVLKIKPCFMMSPLSVAQFLDPAGMKFDLIIFDEASQVEPADALGAIARGRQLLLVGDPKQLPPTTFFSSMSGEGSIAGPAGEAGLVDMESILDRGTMVFPRLPLRWHYRSRHESLIEFSNSEFYNNELVVFPSCHAASGELGLSLVCQPGDPYDRGRSQTNRAQARRVAEWVFDHARRHPAVSLGVGAFSQRQQQAILDEIEKLRQEPDSPEGFFDRNVAEPFFVKNLETIQGDERDVVLLSVGYGKALAGAAGEMGAPGESGSPGAPGESDEPGEPGSPGLRGERLSMNFGPLNQDGGWRRLNVLVTRARRRCVVFTSILGDDFDLGATTARGVHALKRYLDYARSGRLSQAAGGDGECDSPFERAVYNALAERGLEVHRQVGCAGYAIDLAVVDAARPGRYLLGIECDGAAYHGAATARDRDRLRQQVLEGLGWRVHRVWSTEWFRSPERELERIMEAVRQARAGQLQPKLLESGEAGDQAAPEFVDSPGAADELRDVHSYQCYGAGVMKRPEDFYGESVDRLAKLVVKIVKVEGPLHLEELVRRVSGQFGFSRSGTRIEEKVKLAAAVAAARKQVAEREPFLWPVEMTEPPVRRRTGQEARDIELICPEEIGRAAQLLLRAQFGMSREDLVTQTARVLGFQNTGWRIQGFVSDAIDAEIAAGRIVSSGDQLVPAKGGDQAEA